MSLLLIPLGFVVWALCYGPVTGEPDDAASRRPSSRSRARTRR